MERLQMERKQWTDHRWLVARDQTSGVLVCLEIQSGSHNSPSIFFKSHFQIQLFKNSTFFLFVETTYPFALGKHRMKHISWWERRGISSREVCRVSQQAIGESEELCIGNSVLFTEYFSSTE